MRMIRRASCSGECFVGWVFLTELHHRDPDGNRWALVPAAGWMAPLEAHIKGFLPGDTWLCWKKPQVWEMLGYLLHTLGVSSGTLGVHETGENWAPTTFEELWLDWVSVPSGDMVARSYQICTLGATLPFPLSIMNKQPGSHKRLIVASFTTISEIFVKAFHCTLLTTLYCVHIHNST